MSSIFEKLSSACHSVFRFDQDGWVLCLNVIKLRRNPRRTLQVLPVLSEQRMAAGHVLTAKPQAKSRGQLIYVFTHWVTARLGTIDHLEHNTADSKTLECRPGLLFIDTLKDVNLRKRKREKNREREKWRVRERARDRGGMNVWEMEMYFTARNRTLLLFSLFQLHSFRGGINSVQQLWCDSGREKWEGLMVEPSVRSLTLDRRRLGGRFPSWRLLEKIWSTYTCPAGPENTCFTFSEL